MTAVEGLPRTAGELADQLVACVVGQLEALARDTAPELLLPAVFGGHPVDDQTTGDLIYTLAHLAACGVDEVAGVRSADHAGRLVETLAADRVEAFASYRIGEATLLAGAGWPGATRDHAIACADSTPLFDRVRDGQTPKNYAIVAARCLWASSQLGSGDPEALEEFVDRSRRLFDTPSGWINDGMGCTAQYDIYTPDMYLFAEPIAAEVGECWESGLRAVLRDLEVLGQPGGSIVWGRSIGSLGLAITIELAAIGTGRAMTDAPGLWLRRAAEALADLEGWFRAGVLSAHQDRRTMWYRGPARRLQMTFDILGKLLLSAAELRRRPNVGVGDHAEAWPDVDAVIRFSEDGTAAAWSYRRGALSLVVPLLDGRSTDYLASPRSPGLLETPTSGYPVMIPTPLVDGALHAPSGLPTAWHHAPGELTVEHDGWWPLRRSMIDPVATGPVPGRRRAVMRADGRSLHMSEHVEVGGGSGVVAAAVPSVAGRAVRVDTDIDVRRVDTTGIDEWRSFWGPIESVAQLEIPHDGTATLEYRVTPLPRVAGTIKGHPYEDELYRPIEGDVVHALAPRPGRRLELALRDHDVLHLAWPEWWSGVDPERTAATIDAVRRAGIRILWTQHNLVPHMDKSDHARACYALWAEAADAVIHHTESGRDTALRTYDYGDHTTHRVIPHGHWGPVHDRHRAADRVTVEHLEGWGPAALRVAVIGAPRAEKDLESVVDAVSACARDDLQLVVRADDRITTSPDPRIVLDRGGVDEARYVRRLAAIDALIFPFHPHGMLTTGTAFDAIAAGIPAITSDWAFFDETFAGADLRYRSSDDLTGLLDRLTPDELRSAGAAVGARRADHEWRDSAAATLALIGELLA
ncbi:MAG: hypothetical protein AAF480_17075 [Actinomycetota bacterium]